MTQVFFQWFWSNTPTPSLIPNTSSAKPERSSTAFVLHSVALLWQNESSTGVVDFGGLQEHVEQRYGSAAVGGEVVKTGHNNMLYTMWSPSNSSPLGTRDYFVKSDFFECLAIPPHGCTFGTSYYELFFSYKRFGEGPVYQIFSPCTPLSSTVSGTRVYDSVC